MAQVKIERAKAEDAKEILELLKIIGGESDNLSFDKEGLPITEQEEEDFLLNIEKSNTEAFFLAKIGSKIVGTAHYTAQTKKRMAHRGELGICIKKSECGKGIGSMLMETILDFAKTKAKSQILSLFVRSDNENAIKLYKKYGFEKIGCYKGFFKIDNTLIDFDIMEKIF